jgi:hypothetical protein
MTKKRQAIRQCRRYERYLRKLEVSFSGWHGRWTMEGKEQLELDQWLGSLAASPGGLLVQQWDPDYDDPAYHF